MTKKILYPFTVFFISAAIGLFILEKLFDFGMKHNVNMKSSYVATHSLNVPLLILGPCEPLWMVSPPVIEKRAKLQNYNLANSHSDFADNFLHLHLYLEKNSPPKYLLLFVTPESFDLRYNTFYSYRFSAFIHDTVVANTIADCDREFFRYAKIPFGKYAYYSHQSFFSALQGWKHFLSRRKLPYFPDGFEPPAKITWDNHYENIKKAYPKGYSLSWDDRREKYLLKIIALCKQKNIRVIFYESPILSEISEFQFNRGLYLEKIGRIAKENRIEFLKFDKIPWAGNREYFISPMVTTLSGSYLFSDTLGAALKTIISR